MTNRVSTTVAEDLISMLSDREKDIARLHAWGKIKKDIADILHISELTVSVHFRNIYRKIEIHKETDLCRCWIFYENGIADNPLKKVVASIMLVVSISSIVYESSNMLRIFRSTPVRSVARAVKPVKTRRSIKWFDLPQLATA